MKIKKTKHPSIVVFENFVNKKTTNLILELLKSKSTKWNRNDDSEFVKNVLLDFTSISEEEKIFQELVLASANQSSTYFRETFCAVQPSVRKLETKEKQIPHMDNTEMDGTLPLQNDKNDFQPYSLVELAAIIYLNDDYSGGELTFPELQIQFKPKAGSLVVWAGSEMHGVNEIQEGNRYTIVTFLIKARIFALLQSYSLPENWNENILNPEVVEPLLPKRSI
jgi:predicted 2-oxoglutarate/Fe(II)-dependent dioxygenase YbiX